ncbi:MAG: Rne/Rng family ribonuclease [Rhodospirillales bacterium]|nr:Rne/Rng family ribonuclease [Rhodospirillales bacterium]
MATKRMLIDAAHPEETRVVVVDGSRLEEYDVEVATRRQLKGNIYLAKVTRVEPSLQAAFVDYGGNRHGFLAFSEIHPDYYQIPVADREALLAEQAAAEQAVEEAGEGDDDDDEIERRRPRPSPRNYKIQEVIKRRQILLIQVTKEERGTKGAALTTYLSLAGRYCVLMPNTSRGGGISRKISNVTDRKRLKKIIAELEVDEGMAVIVRTAGAGRTKAEIKRDYEYLVRLWSAIRDTTLQSSAPALVYEEGNLIKRSIRDLYDRDTEEIIVQGEAQYRIAKEFMKLFIPSHAKRVKCYEEKDRPLFHQAQVEDQIEAMHRPIIHLKSGSYIVINPTEALVSIDVNSGRATRERHIEETALRTNLEAADEIARQLRLRDLAGLVVIDFIDMENPRNQTQVERRLKDAMKTDRARIQIGRISPFGLLELSRQRMRPSVIETSFETCPMCSGTGTTRTIESASLALIRRIEDEGIRHHAGEIIVTAGNDIALYLLNHKRRTVSLIEERYGFAVRIVGDPSMIGHEFKLERSKTASVQPIARVEEDAVEAVEETPVAAEAAEGDGEDAAKRGGRRRRPRRRRRSDEDRAEIAAGAGAGDLVAAAEDEAGLADEAIGAAVLAADGDDEAAAAGREAGEDDADQTKKRRRRGKRGGRRRGRRPSDAAGSDASELAVGGAAVGMALSDDAMDEDDEEEDADDGAAGEGDGLPAEPLTPFAPSLAIGGGLADAARDDGIVAHASGDDDGVPVAGAWSEPAEMLAAPHAFIASGGDATAGEGITFAAPQPADSPPDTDLPPPAAWDAEAPLPVSAVDASLAADAVVESGDEPARFGDWAVISPAAVTPTEPDPASIAATVAAVPADIELAPPTLPQGSAEAESSGIRIEPTADGDVAASLEPSVAGRLPDAVETDEPPPQHLVIGSGDDEAAEAPRRGWWQRLIT